MKTAIVLFNLGGPDGPKAVKPFLFNLFNDPAIIRAPTPIRLFLAWLISTRREKTAKEIYEHLGGGSPILKETKAQADALETSLGEGFRVFIAMRYWHPFTQETVREVKAWNPDKVILLPLYPQYSTTTSASSLKEWRKYTQSWNVPTHAVCCYFAEERFIQSHVEMLKPTLEKYPDATVLFSAHGLPEKIVASGDPYQWQVEQTAAAVAAKLGTPFNWRVTYQSRVGPLKWIGPSTDSEIIHAAAEKNSIIVVPIAFVSEHSETLVELDIEYRKLAMNHGAKDYIRVPALGTQPRFIESLAKLCREAKDNTAFYAGERVCPTYFSGCPCS